MEMWQFIILVGLTVVGTAPLWVPPNMRARFLSGSRNVLPTPRLGQRPLLEQQLEELRLRVANLLLACERLLEGENPEDTIMYHLFEAYQGHLDPVRNLSVIEWLRRSQAAMDQLYQLRGKLLEPTIIEERGLPQLVRDWESLYVTLVGSERRILELTDRQLHALLDPIEILVPEPEDVQLASQLNALHDEMRYRPLKIDLMYVDPADFDAQGIIGYLELVESQIAELQATEVESTTADEQLEETSTEVEQRAARRRRLGHLPDPHSGLPNRRLTLSERLAILKEQAEQREHK